MALARRLLDLLRQAGLALATEEHARRHCQLAAVALVGSLARDDFRPGGSDVDLMFVHGLGEGPSSDLGARPEMRTLARHFGEPLLRVAGLSGQQKPFMVDCHFVDREVLRTQPVWAAPASFTPALLPRDRFLWLYAFDFLAHATPLWGADPREFVQAFDPAEYLPVAAPDLRWRVAAATADPERTAPSTALVSRWKSLTGELMTLLAIRHGCRSLCKADVHRVFNTGVPYFPGKDFAASLWAECLYGTVFQERADWVARCERFCHNGLAALT